MLTYQLIRLINIATFLDKVPLIVGIYMFSMSMFYCDCTKRKAQPRVSVAESLLISSNSRSNNIVRRSVRRVAQAFEWIRRGHIAHLLQQSSTQILDPLFFGYWYKKEEWLLQTYACVSNERYTYAVEVINLRYEMSIIKVFTITDTSFSWLSATVAWKYCFFTQYFSLFCWKKIVFHITALNLQSTVLHATL